MTETMVLKEDFVKAYAQGIGIEGAEKLIRETSRPLDCRISRNTPKVRQSKFAKPLSKKTDS